MAWAWEIVSTAIGIVVAVVIALWSDRRMEGRVLRMQEGMERRILEAQKAIANDFAHKFIAMCYAQSKASAEHRPIKLEDVREGFEFADEVLKFRSSST